MASIDDHCFDSILPATAHDALIFLGTPRVRSPPPSPLSSPLSPIAVEIRWWAYPNQWCGPFGCSKGADTMTCCIPSLAPARYPIQHPTRSTASSKRHTDALRDIQSVRGGQPRIVRHPGDRIPCRSDTDVTLEQRQAGLPHPSSACARPAGGWYNHGG